MKQSVYDPVTDSFREVDINQYIKKLENDGNTVDEIQEKLDIVSEQINSKINELVPTNSQVVSVGFEIVDGDVIVKPVEIIEVEPEEVLK